ncbi:hypothetical protein J5N58_01170 [Rhizobium cremeum]|uniref:hypothetical protein n=1 Tax=Rhizobium cremeum TaxID=2813827 RepID=UPI001FD3CF4B|nr:hypothetical protein [Rhizobium cremeum]MCJ7993207.1 hypothetical protein [Rhizobium cremeum]MCJ7998272.1 hypothetical protein [Rhizobium cremeum]
MRIRILSAVALTALAVSCAKRPDAIVPADVPMAAYTGSSCPDLARELVSEQEKLAALSKAQNSAATGDAFGVFLIGVPASSAFGGDKEGQVAISKGKVEAIKNAMRSKGCK